MVSIDDGHEDRRKRGHISGPQTNDKRTSRDSRRENWLLYKGKEEGAK